MSVFFFTISKYAIYCYFSASRKRVMPVWACSRPQQLWAFSVGRICPSSSTCSSIQRYSSAFSTVRSPEKRKSFHTWCNGAEQPAQIANVKWRTCDFGPWQQRSLIVSPKKYSLSYLTNVVEILAILVESFFKEIRLRGRPFLHLIPEKSHWNELKIMSKRSVKEKV